MHEALALLLVPKEKVGLKGLSQGATATYAHQVHHGSTSCFGDALPVQSQLLHPGPEQDHHYN